MWKWLGEHITVAHALYLTILVMAVLAVVINEHFKDAAIPPPKLIIEEFQYDGCAYVKFKELGNSQPFVIVHKGNCNNHDHSRTNP